VAALDGGRQAACFELERRSHTESTRPGLPTRQQKERERNRRCCKRGGEQSSCCGCLKLHTWACLDGRNDEAIELGEP
jgi:hypothetical protein